MPYNQSKFGHFRKWWGWRDHMMTWNQLSIHLTDIPCSTIHFRTDLFALIRIKTHFSTKIFSAIAHKVKWVFQYLMLCRPAAVKWELHNMVDYRWYLSLVDMVHLLLIQICMLVYLICMIITKSFSIYRHGSCVISPSLRIDVFVLIVNLKTYQACFAAT